MAVTEAELNEWTLAFCAALENHDGKHSLLDHLRQANQQQIDPELRSILEDVRETVARGHTLSYAFSQHPDVFDEAYVTTVRYGEIYGEIDLALRRYVERPEDRVTKCRTSASPVA